MQFYDNAYNASCALAVLCFVGMLKLVESQLCDSTATAGVSSVRSSPETFVADYGLFLDLENPVTCTGKIPEFEYTFYRESMSQNKEFPIQLSLWRPREDDIYMYDKVYSEEIITRVIAANQGLNVNINFLLGPPVYTEFGDVVGLFMTQPGFMASLVEMGSGKLCNTETDTNTINCAMNSTLTDRWLRLQAVVEPITCLVEEVSITNGSALVGGMVLLEEQPVGTMITYQCDPGFVLSGSPQRTCEAVKGSPNGQWNGSLPTCTQVMGTGVLPSTSQLVHISPSSNSTETPSNAGSIVVGVTVTLGVLLLVVAVIVGVVAIITHRRKASTFDGTAATNQTVSGFDNPIRFISSLYNQSVRNKSRNNGEYQYYSEINTGTARSTYSKKDLGISDEFGMHYEVDCYGNNNGGYSTVNAIQYEEPGVVFVTNAAGREMRTPSRRGNGSGSGSFTTSVPEAPGYYSSVYPTSDYYKLLDQALVGDDGIFEGQNGVSRKGSMMYVKPAAETEALYMQLNSIKVTRIQMDSITLLDHIGSGQYGDVHQALCTIGNNKDIEVAVKKLKKGASSTERIKFLQEAAIMAQFSNPNVLGLLGVAKHEEEVMIVLELMSNGDLRNYLIQMRSSDGCKLSEDTSLLLLGFCRQVCLGMTYLSGKGFVHRDLAARNILISADRICKISDFGMSRDLEDESYYFSHGGKIPVRWTAPEAINYSKYSPASDVWSFGCLMYEIWSLGQKLYDNLSHQEVIEEVSSSYRLPPPPGCPVSQYEIMINSWHPVPKERPDFHTIMLLLLQHDTCILEIPKEALSSHPQAGELGAPLEAGHNMYPDLQKKYKNMLQQP